MIGKKKQKLKNCRYFGEKTEVKSFPPPLHSCFLSSLCLVPLLPNQHMLLLFSVKYLFTPPSILLLFIADHLEKGLQQPVVSVPVRLGSVEAISVVAVDIVLGASVLVEHVQSLVQGLRGQPCPRTTEVGLLAPPGGRRPDWWRVMQGRALPVEGRLEEAQQGHGGGGGRV